MELLRSSFLVFCVTAIIASLQIGPAFATDLVAAVRAGNVARVELLLDSGADPNKRSLYNGPLHDAARIGSAEITTVLIQAGADVELSASEAFIPYIQLPWQGRQKSCPFFLRMAQRSIH